LVAEWTDCQTLPENFLRGREIHRKVCQIEDKRKTNEENKRLSLYFRVNRIREAGRAQAGRVNTLEMKHSGSLAHVLKRNEFRHARLF
jgi:hypothetical protein